MGGRRSDLQSEAIDALPRGVRWLVRPMTALLAVARVIIALQAIGGLIGVVIGAATLNGPLVAAGLGQLLLAGLVLGMHFGAEHVSEVRGPDGEFVVRVGGQRAWRVARGAARLAALARGSRAWTVRVRERKDDPFGPTVFEAVADTERAAVDRATEIERELRLHGRAALLGSSATADHDR